MDHLGMELHAIQLAIMIGNGRLRCIGRMGKTHESLRQRLHRIPMTHPHRGAVIHIGE